MADGKLVTVCSSCFRASCWQGAFYCDMAKSASTVERSVEWLKSRALESTHYWDVCDNCGVAYGTCGCPKPATTSDTPPVADAKEERVAFRARLDTIIASAEAAESHLGETPSYQHDHHLWAAVKCLAEATRELAQMLKDTSPPPPPPASETGGTG